MTKHIENNIMKNNAILLVPFLLALFISCTPRLTANKIFNDAAKQSEYMLAAIPVAKAAKSTIAAGGTPGSERSPLISPRTFEDGQLRLVSSKDWTSGFFPGVCWFLYENTGLETWKSTAEKFTAQLEQEKTNAITHDMGFKIYCSYGTGYRLTDNPHYKAVILQSAATLATRFNPVAGVIKSWDNRQRWKYPVIIDNMMNLELLFAATRLSGDSTFYHIAASHATNTMKNHYRADYSSYHVVDYDSLASNNILQKTTHQGYSDASAWSRGQAWGLYGFTMCYRETKRRDFLEQAERIAAYLLEHPHLPKDMVPYYDFDAPGIPNEPRDASAAAVMASALYELSGYSIHQKKYIAAAHKIMESLARNYRSRIGENAGFILLHSTGSAPGKTEVDVPLSYADYYYLEALLKNKQLRSK